ADTRGINDGFGAAARGLTKTRGRYRVEGFDPPVGQAARELRIDGRASALQERPHAYPVAPDRDDDQLARPRDDTAPDVQRDHAGRDHLIPHAADQLVDFRLRAWL